MNVQRAELASSTCATRGTRTLHIEGAVTIRTAFDFKEKKAGTTEMEVVIGIRTDETSSLASV